MDSMHIIVVLLVILILLAFTDLLRQYQIKSYNLLHQNYIKAVKWSNDFWKLGFRIEDLELKVEFQSKYWSVIKHEIQTALSPKFKIDRYTLRQNTHNFAYTRQSRIALHNLLQNDTSIYLIRCGDNNGPILRIGVNDFRTDKRDACQIYTSTTTSEAVGPHSMFELISFNDATFALKSISNGKFVKTVPPPDDNPSLPWKLVIGGDLVGSAEKFRITDTGKLYSSLMEGFFTCSPGGQMISGSPGSLSEYNSPKSFILENVNKEIVRTSYLLKDLSDQIKFIQFAYSKTHQKSLIDRKSSVLEITGMENPNPVKICIGVPITSKGTIMSDVVDSPFWTNLFDSFMKSIDWRSNRYVFRFYLGFDKADSLYDTGDAWTNIREEFRHRATYRMMEQMMDETSINIVLKDTLSLKLMHFDHLEGAPSQVVSQLMLSAYMDNFDYFYQVNDDTVIVTPNWVPKLISLLASNPSIPNFGVTGPSDSNNDKIFTHSFVHRTHIEVFGHLFPPYFKNWWSDDWISTVYGLGHTFRSDDVVIQHNVEAQKSNGITRYTVDQSAQIELEKELRKGHVQIDEWLKKNSLPRLSLPVICDYIPLVKYLAKDLKEISNNKIINNEL